ncbi:MAG: PQQ-dependent sugar dehydrogenase [Polyangiaceae bacterium]|nr:PQQ-dependent sugar dehydrogenase [Polyangiaceae bacterium]
MRSALHRLWIGPALVVASACGSNGGSSGGNPAPPANATSSCQLVESGFGEAGTAAIRVEVVASGLEVPWGIAFLPDGDMLVTERPGRVRIVSKQGQLGAPIATPAVSKSGEAGLLGIALHPRFAENRQFYVYLTGERDGHDENRVERYVMSEDRSKATLDKVIVGGIPSAQYHDGGRLRFGPDGMLYIGTGDARSPERSQDPKDLAGKILRLTPDGEVPADNPRAGSAAFITGIRNTQGFDWLDDKTLVVSDHGPSGEYQGRTGHDEVSIAHAGDNLGWPTIYGCGESTGMVTPAISWKTANPPGGAAVYRGSAIQAWKGAVLVGGLRSEHLHMLRFGAGERPGVERHEVYLAGKAGYGRLRDVVMGPDGHLYVTTSNCDGRGDCGDEKDRILRIVAAETAPK